MRGDWVEIVVDAGGESRTYEITATRAGRSVEVSIVRNVVTVAEVTRGGSVVRTARFMANRVLALVEHPAARSPLPTDAPADGGPNSSSRSRARSTVQDNSTARNPSRPIDES